MSEMEEKISRLCEIDRQISVLKAEKDELDSYFHKRAEEDLKNSKRKSKTYTAPDGRVIATLAQNVDSQDCKMLIDLFKDLSGQIVKTELKRTLTTTGKRILGGVNQKEYVMQTVEETLRQIAPKELVPLLKKKVRGKTYATDVKNLMAITGCSESEAEENAYLVSMANVWEEMRDILIANRVNERTWPQVLDKLKANVVVQYITKIKLDPIN